MSETIYIVVGHTGEHGDYRDWPVAAYQSEEHASEHVRLASEAATRIFGQSGSGRIPAHAVPTPENPHDPKMQMDHTGTTYEILEVELRTSPPGPKRDQAQDATEKGE